MQERRNPDIINASRKKRIARGSGLTVQDINQLLSSFKQSQKMMKQVMGMQKSMGGRKGKRGLGSGMGGLGGVGGGSPFGF
jgi:signal recognition particle subunit SRP54